MADQQDSAGIRVPPPFIYLGTLLVAYLVGRVIGLPHTAPASPLRVFAGWLFIVSGLAVMFAGIGLFRLNKTAVIPHKPASRLVTGGIYRWSRNPMYLGMALLYGGLAILIDSLLALLVLPLVLAIIQTHVIAREEAYLERRFGDDYRAYKGRVHRWL